METLFSRPAPEIKIESDHGLSPRSYFKKSTSEQWELIWEAGPYYEQVVEALEKAHSYAIFVGWQLDSRLELAIGRHEGFKKLLIRLCEERPDFHIYFLMWDHAYFYVMERELMQEWVWNNVHERIHFIFDNRHPYGGAHHEKIVVVDGETAFVGGVDICNDRWDTPSHEYFDSRRSLRHDREEHLPYHDMSVVVRGEIAADLLDYIGERWKALSSVPFPERPRQSRGEGRGEHHILISRTRASVEASLPVLVRETEFLFRDLIRATERQLIIEQQYYWSPRMNEEMIALMRRRAHQGLRIFIVVPPGCEGSLAFRLMGNYQTQLIDGLYEVARETGTRLHVGCPYARSPDGKGEKPVYVHSKVVAVDDRYLSIGSPNFNNRGFRLDTELTLTLLGESEQERQFIGGMARRLVAHWGAEAYKDFYDEPPLGIGLRFEPHLHLLPYHEAWDGYLGTLEAWLGRVLPVRNVFDPNVSMTFALKARLSRSQPARLRRAAPVALAGALMLSLGTTLIMLAAFYAMLGPEWRAPRLAWVVAYAFFMSTSWMLSVPLLIASVCAGVQFGARPGALLVFCGLATALVFGYAYGRILPTLASRHFAGGIPIWFKEKLGMRQLGVAFRAVSSLSVSFQSKAVGQGIFSLPVRWVALTSLGVFPLYLAAALLGGFLDAGTWNDAIPLLVSICFITMSILMTLRKFAETYTETLR